MGDPRRVRWFAVPALLVALAAAGCTPTARTAEPVSPSAAPVATAGVPDEPAVRLTAYRQDSLLSESGAGFDVRGLPVGVQAVGGPVEFRRWRPADGGPIRTTVTLGRPPRRTFIVPAPAGADVQVLPEAFEVLVDDEQGRRVSRSVADFCPVLGEATPQPDSGAQWPYPEACGSTALARGALLGIPDGWSVPAFGTFWTRESDSARQFATDAGCVNVTVTLTEPYRRVLGVPPAGASFRYRVALVRAEEGGEPERGRCAGGQPADQAARPPAPVPPVEPPPENGSPTGREVRTSPGRPDLRVAALTEVSGGSARVRGRWRSSVDVLATVWNAGTAPLVVDGYRGPSRRETMAAYQQFLDDRGRRTESVPLGVFRRQLGWELDGLLRYDLLAADRITLLDTDDDPACLGDDQPIDLLLPHAALRVQPVLADRPCGDKGLTSVRQVLDVGWSSRQTQTLDRDSFLDVSRLSPGTYYVRVTADPNHRLAEASTANNSVLLPFRLTGSPGARRTVQPG